MRFIYLTAKKYPGGTADHNYILNLAKAFFEELGANFKMIVCNTKKINGLPVINVIVPRFIKRTIFFFFWIPYYSLLKLKNDETIFFSNDQNLLAVLIFWKKNLGLSYKIVADWHLLTETWKDRYIARNANLSITTSNKLRKAIKSIVPFAVVQTVFGGVSIKEYHQLRDVKAYRERLGLPAEKFLIGYVGLFRTMGKEKGIKTMIDSLFNLGSNCVMVFVGGKNDEIEYYKQYATEKKVIDRCVFLPIQPFSKVVLFEQVMDILVIPYPDSPHFRKYGFPMKVYEYMASGVPIVYTKLDLLEEIVSDCAYGIEAGNSNELAKIIEYIQSNPDKVKSKVSLALEKVTSLDWIGKARSIISASAIIPGMLTIPNRALSYILFQRTEFSIYQSYPKLLRLVMNKRIPIYNMAIKLEALLLPGRTKRLFSLDMEKEIDTIGQYLPSGPKNILDIGCGVAGIDIMLNKHYTSKGIHPSFYLLDKTQVNPKVYYGFERQAAYYNSLEIAKELLVSNGVEKDLIHLQEVGEKKIFSDSKFDLVVSLISWGFHYPVSTYLDQVFDLLNVGGRLIIDVRKESDGEQLLESKFGSVEVIYEARKHRRILAIKK